MGIFFKNKLTAEKFTAPVDDNRIQVKIGFAYGSEASRVRKMLTEIAAKQPGVSLNQKPCVRFRTISYRSMDFELLCWVESPERRGSVAQMLNESIYRAFMADGSKHQVMYTILT